MADYRATAVSYLKRVRDESGLSLNEVAQRIGVSHTTLTRPVNNPAYKYVPKFATLQRIAALTGIPLPAELTDQDIRPLSSPSLKLLNVRGVVAAGMWQSVELTQDAQVGEVHIVEEPRFSGIPQWAELVRGPSMNRSYNDGDYLHVVDWAALGYSPRAGLDVIVERRAAHDGKVERTCKRLAAVNGGLVLVGDSTVDAWNAPLPLDNGPDTIVQIVGLVIGSYRPRPVF